MPWSLLPAHAHAAWHATLAAAQQSCRFLIRAYEPIYAPILCVCNHHVPPIARSRDVHGTHHAQPPRAATEAKPCSDHVYATACTMNMGID